MLVCRMVGDVAIMTHDRYISKKQYIQGMGFRSLEMGMIFRIGYPDLYKIMKFHYKYYLTEDMKTKHCSFIVTNQNGC